MPASFASSVLGRTLTATSATADSCLTSTLTSFDIAPLQSIAATRQCAVTVTASGDGPHVTSPGGPIVRLIFDGLLTVVWNTTSVSFGAHLTNSPTLPELPMPALLEKVMVTGFADH